MSNLGKKSLMQLRVELEDLKNQQFELTEVRDDLKNQTEAFEKKIQSLQPTSSVSAEEKSELKLQIAGNRAAIQPIASKIESIMARLGNVGKALRRHSSAPSQSKMTMDQINLNDTEGRLENVYGADARTAAEDANRMPKVRLNLEDTESRFEDAEIEDTRTDAADTDKKLLEIFEKSDSLGVCANCSRVQAKAGKATCDSIEECERFSSAVRSMPDKSPHIIPEISTDTRPAARKSSRRGMTQVDQSATSCNSFALCGRCEQATPMQDIRYALSRDSSRRISQMSQLDACVSFQDCQNCASIRNTEDAPCESLNDCSRCAEVMGARPLQVQRPVSRMASQRRIVTPFPSAMPCQSCQSIGKCEDCTELDYEATRAPRQARLPSRQSSRRIMIQDRSGTSCDSASQCLNCASNIHSRPQNNRLTSSRMSGQRLSQRKHASCDSFGDCPNCANIRNTGESSCDSFNKCHVCAMDGIPQRAAPVSRIASRGRMLGQLPEAMSCQSIGRCEDCAELNKVRSDLRPTRLAPRKSSQRIFQRRQLETLCDYQDCANIHNNVETSCDSLNECSRCAQAVDGAQPKVSRLAAKVASQKILLSHQAATSCESIGKCEDCAELNDVTSNPTAARLAWRKLSQRIFQQRQLDAPCDSMGDCQDCAEIRNSGETSCDSLNECSRCAKAVDGARLARLVSKVASQKIMLPQQSAMSCQSIGKCEDCTELRDAADDIKATQRISQPCQLDPSCESFGVCQDCANICNTGGTSCDSLNECNRCKEAIDGAKITSQERVPAKCPSAMSCQSIGACEDCTELCNEAAVDAKPAPRSTPSKTSQKKQPMKNKTLVVGRQQPSFTPSSSSSLGKSASGGSVDKCGNSRKPTPGRTLLRLKRPVEFNNLDCPSNPCESLEKAKIDRKRRVTRKNTPPKKRITPIEELPEPEDEDDCVPHQKESTCDRRSDIDYSKKYLKMRYEIETQNYLIDKMNRVLQKKILKGRPEMELCTLNNQLAKESHKLRQMVQFAIMLQRCDRKGKWGPIPISAAGEPHERRSRSLPRESTQSTKPPQTPSDITVVSGFEQLEEIMLNDDKECCMAKLALKLKEEKIQEFSIKIDEMSAELEKAHRERVKLSADGVECEQLFDMKTASVAVNQILGQVEQMQFYIKKLQKDFHEYKNKSME